MAAGATVSAAAGWQDYKPQAQGGWQDYQEAKPSASPARQAAPPETDRSEIPLTSHSAATEQGFNRVAEGAQHAVEGAANTIIHPIDTAKRMMAAPGELMHQIGQIPDAIHDINSDPDPVGTYLQAAGRTAGEGGGQALASIAGAKAPEAAASLPLGRMARVGGKMAMGAAKDIPVVGQLAKAGKYWDDTAPPPVFSKVRLGPDNPGTAALTDNALRSEGLQPAPGLSGTRLGPDAPPADALAYNKIRAQGLRPGGLRQGPAAPPPEPAAALGKIPGPAAVFPKSRLGPDAPPPEVGQARGLGGYVERDPAEALGNIPVAAPEPPSSPINFPPDEPTGRFQIPGPETPNPHRLDMMEDQGIQQDMRQYLDKQDRDVHAFEPMGTPKGEMNQNFNEAIGKPSPPVRYTKTPSSASPKSAATGPEESDLTPQWQAELDRVKSQKKKGGR